MKNDRLHMRIDPETKDKLKELAEKDGRTISNYILHLINKTYDDTMHGKSTT